MTSPPMQPPGWYTAQGDQPGTHRWWDGAQWVGGPVAVGGVAPSPYEPPTPFGAPVPPYGYGYAPVSRPRYAGWWARFAAMIIDRIALGIPVWIILAVTVAAVPKHLTTCTTSTGRRGVCETPTGGGFAVIAVVGLLCFVGVVAYFALLHGRTGQTLGKKALGIKVVDQRTGAPIGVGRGVGRFFGMILSSFFCSLGFLWAAWDAEKQTWHDKMVTSIVIAVN